MCPVARMALTMELIISYVHECMRNGKEEIAKVYNECQQSQLHVHYSFFFQITRSLQFFLSNSWINYFCTDVAIVML